MRWIPAAVALLALLAAPAAAGSSCTVLSDPAGDATISGAPSPDPHADVRTVRVETGRSGLTFRIALTDLVDGRHGEWHVTFDARGARLFVGAGNGTWVNAGRYTAVTGFRAGVVGKRLTEVRGIVDYFANEVRVDVPHRAFGSAAPRRGDTLTGFAVEAREVFVNVNHPPVPANQARVVDTGRASTRYVVGRC